MYRQFFHVSTVNQRSWACCLTELVNETDRKYIRVAAELGHRALMLQPVDLAAIGDPFAACGIAILPCQFFVTDLSNLCVCTLFEIVREDKEVDEFCPCHLEVKVLQEGVDPFWPGSAVALAAAKQVREKKDANAHLGKNLVGPACAPSEDPGGCGGGPVGAPPVPNVEDGDPLCEEAIPDWAAIADAAAAFVGEEDRSLHIVQASDSKQIF